MVKFFRDLADVQRRLQFSYCGFTDEEFHPEKTAPARFGDLVFLRGLRTSRRLMITNRFGSNRPDIMAYPREPEKLSLEAALHRAFMRDFVDWTFGGVYDAFGMTRGGSGYGGKKYWQNAVEVALRVADVIFLLPEDSEGVIWDINLLLTRGTRARVVFIMLPEYIEGKASHHWKILSHRLLGEQFQISKYSPDGGYYLVKSMEHKTGALIPFQSLFDSSLYQSVVGGLLPRRDRAEHVSFAQARKDLPVDQIILSFD
jgi:hypothetical protein